MTGVGGSAANGSSSGLKARLTSSVWTRSSLSLSDVDWDWRLLLAVIVAMLRSDTSEVEASLDNG